MNINISVSDLALNDNYGSLVVGKWYRLPFQYSEVSLTLSNKNGCSISYVGGSRYSVVARVDQLVNDVYNSDRGQLLILSLDQQNLYFFGDYWEMYDQQLKDCKPGDYVEGEVELFLDCGLMRPFEYGLYDTIPESERNGFYLVRIARILAETKGGATELERVDGSVASKYDNILVECEPGTPDDNYLRDNLIMKTLDFYLGGQIPAPIAER